MITKNIFKYLAACFVCCGLSVAFTSCSSDEDPFFSASEDDYPRIINTDLPEGKGGEPAALPSIERTTNFTCEVIVTPVHYTTVTWFVDDEQVGEGLKIDVPVLAGDHLVKVVATTTKGLSTYRLLTLNVRPATDDPELAKDGRSRWLTIGTTTTIDCKNIKNNVTKVFIGKTEASNVSYADGKLTFDIPAMDEGEYTVIIEADGMRYGCGVFTVSTEEYQDPGEREIYEGPSEKLAWSAIAWVNDDYVALGLKPGMTVKVYVNADEGAAGAIATSWWKDINTGIQWDEPEGGCRQELPEGKSVMTYTIATTQYMDEQGFAVIGNGFVVEKITVEEPSETVIYEGPSDKLAWNAITWSADEFPSLGIKVGTVITVYYIADEGAAGAIATSWWKDINTGIQWDEPEGGCKQDLPEGKGKMEYEVTTLDYLNEQGLGIVGNAYIIEKVTIK